MLAVVCFRSRRFRKFKIEQCFAGATPYLLVNVYGNISQRAKRRLQKALRRQGARVLLPRDMPYELGINGFDTTPFYASMLFAGVREIIEKSNIRRSSLYCGVSDYEERYVNLSATLISFCGALKIFCKQPSEYLLLSEQLMLSHGCGLVVAPLKTRCEILLEPSSGSFYVNQKQYRIFGESVTGYSGLLRELPDGILPMDFLALLFSEKPLLLRRVPSPERYWTKQGIVSRQTAFEEVTLALSQCEL